MNIQAEVKFSPQICSSAAHSLRVVLMFHFSEISASRKCEVMTW